MARLTHHIAWIAFCGTHYHLPPPETETPPYAFKKLNTVFADQTHPGTIYHGGEESFRNN